MITSSLVSRLEMTGRLDMGSFYLARIRRPLPALAVMLTVVLIASIALGAIGAIGALGTTARTEAAASLINANNSLMVFDVGGYFEASSAFNPLLYTWSLSVEEQFYPVFPGLVFVTRLSGRTVRRLNHRSRIRLMLIVIIAASFGVAGLAGAVLVVIGLLVISESVTYPGPITLLPVVGAVSVIAAGTCGVSNRSVAPSPPSPWLV